MYHINRYLTDDRDSEDPHELVVMVAPNGDYYISVVPEGEHSVKGVRICTSGGCASRNPKLLKAVYDMFTAMGGWDEAENIL